MAAFQVAVRAQVLGLATFTVEWENAESGSDLVSKEAASRWDLKECWSWVLGTVELTDAISAQIHLEWTWCLGVTVASFLL